MAIPSGPLTVFVRKPSALSFGEAMSSVRTWLDHRKIQPSEASPQTDEACRSAHKT